MTEPWLSTHIERWSPEKLVPYARNARTHSEEQVAQIAASIVEFGFTNPILAGSDGVIVAGHGRLAAAQKLGLDTVPVVVLDHLTPTQRRALIIADNRIAENAGWDDAMLRIELQSLQEDGFNLDITGFDADALAELMAGEETTVDGNTDEDAVPEVSFGAEGFTIEELIFDEAVNGFDIALPRVGLGWDVMMVTAERFNGRRQAALFRTLQEFRAVIGLPLDGGQIDAVPSQMSAHALS